MPNKVHYHSNCISCKGNYVQIKNYMHAHMVKCIQCNLVFSSRIPNNDELLQHYANYPRNAVLSAITRLRYIELLNSFEKYRNTNKLLDIGCGNGDFLIIAKEKGWDIYGSEYDLQAVEIATKKGIQMHHGSITQATFANNSFDIITSFEVLEHLNTPVQEIEKINQLLRPNGIAYITTPNYNAMSRLILGKKWTTVEYPEHLTLFTPFTLNKLLDDANFNKVYCKTTGLDLHRIKSTFLNNGKNIAERNSSDFQEQLRESMEKNKLLSTIIAILNWILNTLKIGDAMKIMYQKK